MEMPSRTLNIWIDQYAHLLEFLPTLPALQTSIPGPVLLSLSSASMFRLMKIVENTLRLCKWSIMVSNPSLKLSYFPIPFTQSSMTNSSYTTFSSHPFYLCPCFSQQTTLSCILQGNFLSFQLFPLNIFKATIIFSRTVFFLFMVKSLSVLLITFLSIFYVIPLIINTFSLYLFFLYLQKFLQDSTPLKKASCLHIPFIYNYIFYSSPPSLCPKAKQYLHFLTFYSLFYPLQSGPLHNPALRCLVVSSKTIN